MFTQNVNNNSAINTMFQSHFFGLTLYYTFQRESTNRINEHTFQGTRLNCNNTEEISTKKRSIFLKCATCTFIFSAIHNVTLGCIKTRRNKNIYSLPPGGRPLVIRYGLCDIRYYTYDIIHTILYTAILFEQENKCQLAHAQADVTRMHDSFTRYDTIRI